MSVEPSSRSCRSSYASDFQPDSTDTSEINLDLGALVSQGEPSVVCNLDGNSPVLAIFLFQSKDEIDIEEFLESPMTPLTPLLIFHMFYHTWVP